MSKELRYQDAAQLFIENRGEAYSGARLPIYTEEFSTKFDAALQDGVSPLIRDASVCPELAVYGIVGLAQKILELNEPAILAFIEKHQLSVSVGSLVASMFEDFQVKHKTARREEELFALIFAQVHEVPATDAQWRRQIRVAGAPEPLDYNVIWYEKPGEWCGKNAMYVIRERRIPVKSDVKHTERPDFLVYLNGIPLVLIEYKTEDSGIVAAYKDFDFKESYHCAPFKVAVNDGDRLTFFCNIESLRLRDGKNSAFDWIHYNKEDRRTHPDGRVYSNAEYFYDELLARPENLLLYCLAGCSVTQDPNTGRKYLVNARIQQYFALKDTLNVLQRVVNKQVDLAFNYAYLHAQRSGKTITMKLLCYLVAKQFSQLFGTVFMYTPDLQIKDVLRREFSRAGYTQAVVESIDTRSKYLAVVKDLIENPASRSVFKVYIVNMQKLTDKGELPNLCLDSTSILNIIDEAHYGQARDLAALRDKIFPSATNFLFTATAKSEMLAHYFPDNNAVGFRSCFTLSDAKRCGIIVPVHFLKAEKTFQLSEKLELFAREMERRTSMDRHAEALAYDIESDEDALSFAGAQIRNELKSRLAAETPPQKLAYICAFLDTVAQGLEFRPKAIIYVSSVEQAIAYIKHIQAETGSNTMGGYRFGVDFAALTPESCVAYNGGIAEPKEVEGCFLRTRNGNDDKAISIDVLVAVDKYQKGFDLPELMATFLDTSILEPARMNQIYTRAATKRTGKNLGYCVDLSLDSKNAQTFKDSMSLYDNEESADCFIDEAMLEVVTSELKQSFDAIMDALALAPTEFSTGMILDRVLNEPDVQVRTMRQNVFFRTSLRVFSALAKIGSPLYYRPFALELSGLAGAFTAFKEIYAATGTAERAKILISLDSTGDAAYFSSTEIKKLIGEVLAFVKASNLTSLVNFSYVANKHSEVTPDGRRGEMVEKARDEKKVSDVKDAFDPISSALRASHKSLYEQIRDLLYRISEDRALSYDKDIQAELAAVNQKMKTFRDELKTTVRDEFGGSSLLYWLCTEAKNVFDQHSIAAPHFARHVAAALEAPLRIHMSQLEVNQPVSEKVRSAVDFATLKIGARFSSFWGGYAEATEKPALAARVKLLKEQATARAVESPFNDAAAFREFLKLALTRHYQH